MSIRRFAAVLLCAALAARHATAQNMPNTQTAPVGAVTNSTQLPADFSNLNAASLFNYTRTWVPMEPMTDPSSFSLTYPAKSIVTTTYTNGWGSPQQSIRRGNSNVNTDVISIADLRSSQTALSLLPYAIPKYSHFQLAPYSGQDAYYNSLYSGEQGNGFSKTVADAAAGVHTTTSYAAGLSFVGQGRGTSSVAGLNSSLTGLYRVWTVDPATGLPVTTATYADDMLAIATTTSQHGQQAITVTDKDGKTICKQTPNGSGGWLTSYYVYDDMGRLAWIIPPMAVNSMSGTAWVMSADMARDLCFHYWYDGLGAKIGQSIPGKKDDDIILYDTRRRQVLAQDPVMKQAGVWQFTIYNQRNQPVISGYTHSHNTYAQWQDLMFNSGSPATGSLAWYLTNPFDGTYPSAITDCDINEYDYYDFPPAGQDPDFPDDGNQFNTSFAANYLTGTAMVTPQPFGLTNGMLTGRRVRVINPPTGGAVTYADWTYSYIFYDQKGRAIQTQTLQPWNIPGTNRWDVHSLQYNFNGQQVLDIKQLYAWDGASKPATNIITRTAYDAAGRVAGVTQQLDGQDVRTIATYAYNELGQLSSKSLGGIEVQDIDYNIRGQVTGINAAYAADQYGTYTNKTFGEQVNYDFGFDNPRYDGKIAGYRWRGSGHSYEQAYGYGYDKQGHLSEADYNEWYATIPGSSSMSWNKNWDDFSMKDTRYDENGNIVHMAQMATKPFSGGILMDDLYYYYNSPNSSYHTNQLTLVNDAASQTANYGDYHNPVPATATAYTYDDNGNLTSDLSKKITATTYNYANQPLTIINANGDVISNLYDADGALIQKTITMAATGTPVTYRYQGPLHYQDNDLSFLLHGEGKCRWLTDSSIFKYDYSVKDHLGNVRTVQTTDPTPLKIYTATHEVFSAHREEQLFDNIDSVRGPKPLSPGPDDVEAADLKGDENPIGTSMLMQVNAGDAFSLSGQAYYDPSEDGNDYIYDDGNSMMSSLLGVMSGGATPALRDLESANGGADVLSSMFGSANYLDVYDNLKNSSADPTQPRAYLNYIVFDEKMNVVPGQSGALQVSAAADGNWEYLAGQVITLNQNGYVAFYMSNEQQRHVWFDNMQIQYWAGRQVQEVAGYYPYGLPYYAQAIKGDNKYLYQDKELQNDIGQQLYDFGARQYDPQIGRFASLDPMSQYISGYIGMGNNPAKFTDPTGMQTVSGGGGGSSTGGAPAGSNNGGIHLADGTTISDADLRVYMWMARFGWADIFIYNGTGQASMHFGLLGTLGTTLKNAGDDGKSESQGGIDVSTMDPVLVNQMAENGTLPEGSYFIAVTDGKIRVYNPVTHSFDTPNEQPKEKSDWNPWTDTWIGNWALEFDRFCQGHCYSSIPNEHQAGGSVFTSATGGNESHTQSKYVYGNSNLDAIMKGIGIFAPEIGLSDLTSKFKEINDALEAHEVMGAGFEAYNSGVEMGSTIQETFGPTEEDSNPSPDTTIFFAHSSNPLDGPKDTVVHMTFLDSIKHAWVGSIFMIPKNSK